MAKRKKKHKPQQSPGKSSAKTIEQQEELVNLYKDGSTDDVDMTTLERRNSKKSLITLFTVVIVLLSAIAAILGYLVLGPERSEVKTGEVTLTITAPSTAPSGDELDLTIEYTNNSNATISTGYVEVLYPQGYYFRSSDPQPVANQNEWAVNHIPSGTSGTIHLKGQLVGQVDEVKDFTALFTYTPENFSSNFQVTSRASVKLDKSIITLDSNSPDRARTGEDIEYEYIFTNTSSLPLVNAKAQIHYPEGFDVTTAEPKATRGDDIWTFEEIAPGDSIPVKVNGKVSAAGGHSLEFITQAGVAEPNGFFNVQTEARTTIPVINPEITLELSAAEFSKPGEELEYTIVAKNPSEVDLTDLELQLLFNTDSVDAKEVILSTIDTLKAGATEELHHTATIKDNVPADVTEIIATLSVLSTKVDDINVEFDTKSEVNTKLQGSIELTAQGRYYDDNLKKIGSGPTPPEVDATTIYVIRWTIAAQGSSMSQTDIKTTLPDNVTYVGSDDDRISFDKSNRTVTLALRNVPANENKTADFSVSITPTKQDTNSLMVLTNDAVATALDTKSQQTIQAQAKRITTHLTTDPEVDDDGVVVKP